MNTTADKTRQFCLVSTVRPSFQRPSFQSSSIYLKLNSCKLHIANNRYLSDIQFAICNILSQGCFVTKPKLSCLVCSCVHTADTDKTRQSCRYCRCRSYIKFQKVFITQVYIADFISEQDGLDYVSLYVGLNGARLQTYPRKGWNVYKVQYSHH